MINSFYEDHNHLDPNFSIIFHPNFIDKCSQFNEMMHWHESIELIYFTEGEGKVMCGPNEVLACAGDLIVINSNDLHRFEAITKHASYYCLIIHTSIYEGLGLETSDLLFENKIKNPKCISLYNTIIHEMNKEDIAYKVAVKALIANLLVELIRHHSEKDNNLFISNQNNKKITLVKNAIRYIQKHYRSDISIDDICLDIGFSKYYFCRTFKEITDKTVTDYINYLRCQHAQKLLRSGNYNVTESCELAGFNSLPYFSRIYKKYMGCSPSSEK